MEFGGISLDYSTVDGEKLLSFTINNKTYFYEEGMTWGVWLLSKYNTDGSYYEGGICFGSGGSISEGKDTYVSSKNIIGSEPCPA